MRHLSYLLVFMFGVLLCSCDPCSELDCNTNDYYGQFRIVSAVDGTDLLFGPNKIYDNTQIKFYSLNAADTTFFSYQLTEFSGDSILLVKFLSNPGIAYMKLNNLDTDTLNISYNTTKTKCCGMITNIVNFRLNDVIDLPTNMGNIEIKK